MYTDFDLKEVFQEIKPKDSINIDEASLNEAIKTYDIPL
jgi:hypothetical protein